MPKTRSYTDFLKSLSALAGMTNSRVTIGGDIEATWRVLLSNAVRDMHERGNWLEVCPYGEARFAGNKLTYPNDLSASVWTATAATITRNAAINPLDGKQNASQMFEVATDTEHGAEQAVATLIPETEYRAAIYARSRGRTELYLEVDDGDEEYYAIFNLEDGTVTEESTGVSASMTRQANNYWLCEFTLTTSTDADANGFYRINLGATTTSDGLITDLDEPIVDAEDGGQFITSDGDAVTSYLGDITKGQYFYGALLQQISMTGREDNTVPFDQDGEEGIETVFDVYSESPVGKRLPQSLAYQLTPTAIQLISTASPTTFSNGVADNITAGAAINPVFLYYRTRCPQFEGPTFDVTETYAIGEQVYFVNSASVGNFYKCEKATTAGQSPDTTPLSWSVLAIHDTFFQAAVYRTYADWLIADGQMDKAPGALAIAERFSEQAFDRLERQAGHLAPFKVSTHLSARTN